MCELARLSVTRSIRRMYRLLGWLGLTCLDTRGERVTPSRWRRVYNLLLILIVLTLQLWVGYLGVVLAVADSKSSIISISLEMVTRCTLFVSLVHTFNRPALLKALDRTADVVNFRLTYEKLNRYARMIDRCLTAIFVFHLIQDVWYFMKVSKPFFVNRVFQYYDIPDDGAWVSAVYSYILVRSPTLMTSIFRVLIAKMYLEVGSRFKILLCRLRHIRYVLDSSAGNTQHRSLFHVARVLDAHAVVRGALQEVVHITQLPLLAMTVHTMSKILISTFFFIVHCREKISSSGTITKTSFVSMGLLLAVNVIHILWFIAISEPCNKIIDMDRELCSLVAGCLRRVSPAEVAEGLRTTHALESLRRVTEERAACALHFNLMGICEIDRFMLVKILGIVSTYLILLIQYQYEYDHNHI